MFIYVSGNLASGKSTLIDRMAQCAGWYAAREASPPHEYLTDLFADPSRWALESQLAFTASKADAVRRLDSRNGCAMIDRSIYEHAHVFAKRFYEMGAMDERAYGTYMRIYELLLASLPPPAFVVLCACPPAVCRSRIMARNRPADALYPPHHPENLHRLIETWATTFTLAPLCELDTSRYDVREASVFAAIARDLGKALVSATTSQLEVLRWRYPRSR